MDIIAFARSCERLTIGGIFLKINCHALIRGRDLRIVGVLGKIAYIAAYTAPDPCCVICNILSMLNIKRARRQNVALLISYIWLRNVTNQDLFR